MKSIKKQKKQNICLQTKSEVLVPPSSHSRSSTTGWWPGRGGPSGGDHLDVVGGVEAHLAAAQPTFAPALLVLLAQLQQLLACRGRQSHSRLIQNTVQTKRWATQLIRVLTTLPLRPRAR